MNDIHQQGENKEWDWETDNKNQDLYIKCMDLNEDSSSFIPPKQSCKYLSKVKGAQPG